MSGETAQPGPGLSFEQVVDKSGIFQLATKEQLESLQGEVTLALMTSTECETAGSVEIKGSAGKMVLSTLAYEIDGEASTITSIAFHSAGDEVLYPDEEILRFDIEGGKVDVQANLVLPDELEQTTEQRWGRVLAIVQAIENDKAPLTEHQAAVMAYIQEAAIISEIDDATARNDLASDHHIEGVVGQIVQQEVSGYVREQKVRIPLGYTTLIATQTQTVTAEGLPMPGSQPQLVVDLRDNCSTGLTTIWFVDSERPVRQYATPGTTSMRSQDPPLGMLYPLRTEVEQMLSHFN